MKKENAFFAARFREALTKWKTTNHKTQEDFAEIIGCNKNSISNYCTGKQRPNQSTLEVICKTLNIDESYFFPQTCTDKFQYDEQFQKTILQLFHQEEQNALQNIGIDFYFWEFMWRSVPHIHTLIPLLTNATWLSEDVIASRVTKDLFLNFTQQDLEYFRNLQQDVIEHIAMELTKKVVKQLLEATYKGNCTPEAVASQLDVIVPILASALLSHAKKEEAVHGND